MKAWLRKALIIFISIVLPSILVELIIYKMGFVFYRWSGLTSAVIEGILLYSITIIGLIQYYRFKICGIWSLIVGFFLPVLVCYVNDTLNDSEWLTYINTIFITLYYSIPMVLVIVIITIIGAVRKNKQRYSSVIKKRKVGDSFLSKLTIQEIEQWCKRKKESLLSAGILAVTFLFLTVICAVHISRIHMVRKDIIKKIDLLMEQEGECVFNLSEVTRFKWDKVAYFEYPVSEKEISRALGADYTGGTDVAQGFVFAYRGKVVYTDIVGIIPGGNRVYLSVEGGSLIVLTKEDAVFKGRKIDDTFYLIKPILY